MGNPNEIKPLRKFLEERGATVHGCSSDKTVGDLRQEGKIVFHLQHAGQRITVSRQPKPCPQT